MRNNSEATDNDARLPVLLAINAGSSSLKFGLFSAPQCERIARGQIEDLSDQARFKVRVGDERQALDLHRSMTQAEALERIFEWIGERRVRIVAAVHRVVHSGGEFDGAVVVNDEVVERLAALTPLAPLHQPHNVGALKRLMEMAPEIPQVACFDTAAHAHWGPLAYRYPLPSRIHEQGYRRYGFHGLSYAYIARRLAQIDPAASRVVVAHLGSGASLCALRDGRSVDCSFGYSPLGGIPMATRSGDLDPGLLIALTRDRPGGIDEVEQLVSKQGGLAGWSDGDGDMRDLLAKDDDASRLAVAQYCLAIAKAVASMTTVLGGLDALVYTAGVGENAAPVRAQICERLSWLGIRLNASANADGADRLHADDSRVRVYRLATDEEQQMADEAAGVLGW